MKKMIQTVMSILLAFWQGFFPVQNGTILKESKQENSEKKVQEVSIVEHEGQVEILVENEKLKKEKDAIRSFKAIDNVTVKLEDEPHFSSKREHSPFGLKLKALSGTLLYGERMKQDEE